MRLFSSIYMRQNEVSIVLQRIQQSVTPIKMRLGHQGLVEFVPVKVKGLLLKSFEPVFLCYPNIGAFRDTMFLYAYDEKGGHDHAASDADIINMAIEHEKKVAGFLIPRSLRDGDIVLGTMR